MSRTIVLATRNAGKVREIREALAGLPVELVVRDDLPELPELGASFLENARGKARAAARFTGEWALADDSGLEVDALGGAPGLRSARWSGGGAEENNERLLRELRGVAALEERTARFRAAVAVASPDGAIVAEAEGTCEGLIGFERRGTGGFGYDPLFIIPSLGRTMAELEPGEKNALSHRGRALRALREILTRTRPGII